MDNELFELCREVYEKTGWRTGRVLDSFGASWSSGHMPSHKTAPQYTSDYLLEKLPSKISPEDYTGEYFLTLRKGNVDAHASYEYDYFTVMSGHADTPLKALLRLTLALKEAGEL